MEEAPLVSIICITYNHENFIAKAIDGFLMQITQFDFEILIHDDCSTDGTVEIIKDYTKRYSERIKPIYQNINQYSLGKRIVPIVLPLCKGKYVAICEGDDYWTDTDKLQVQVDYLESHPDISLCFHNMEVIHEDESKPAFFSNFNQKEITSINDLAKGNYIYTASTMFRNQIREFPSWFNCSPVGDWPLFLLLAQRGNIGYIDSVMGVYRIHKGGVWAIQNRELILKKWIRVVENCRLHFGENLAESFNINLGGCYWELMHIYKKNSLLKSFQYSVKLFFIIKNAKGLKALDLIKFFLDPYYTNGKKRLSSLFKFNRG